MTDENSQNLGLPGAHSRAEKISGATVEADQARATKVGSVKATAEAALSDLAQQLTGEDEDADQLPLMLDEMDAQHCLFGGPVKHVADKIDASRRGPGRPKGSQNKASREFADVLQRMGYRHPGLNLAAIANADPAELADQLSRTIIDPTTNEKIHQLCSPETALGFIAKANAELLPYFESKAPTKVNVDKTMRLGVMVIGDMPAPQGNERTTIDLISFPEPE